MKTVRLQDNIVQEIVPHLPVEQWYGVEFAAMCVEVDNDRVEQGWIYDPVSGTVSPPPEPEPGPEPPQAMTNEEITQLINILLGVS